MKDNKLCLNADKTHLMICGTSQKLSQANRVTRPILKPISRLRDRIEELQVLLNPNRYCLIIYSGYQLRNNKAVTTVTFSLFQPSFQRISGTKDTSFESPNIGCLEF